MNADQVTAVLLAAVDPDWEVESRDPLVLAHRGDEAASFTTNITAMAMPHGTDEQLDPPPGVVVIGDDRDVSDAILVHQLVINDDFDLPLTQELLVIDDGDGGRTQVVASATAAGASHCALVMATLRGAASAGGPHD